MCVKNLGARCKTESCHRSIHLSMCDEKHYDNTQFSQSLWREPCGALSLADQQCFSKYPFMKTKETAL